jgi:hypothetical protein
LIAVTLTRHMQASKILCIAYRASTPRRAAEARPEPLVQGEYPAFPTPMRSSVITCHRASEIALHHPPELVRLSKCGLLTFAIHKKCVN